ncbi:MAG: class I SAM-dependent methyltransferase, partial [Bacteroidia bacterium]
MNFNNKNWPLQRFPKTNNRSLRAWSAADELLLSLGQNEGFENKKLAIAHDTFGAMATALSAYKPLSVVLLKSQLLATKLNFKNNGLDPKNNTWSHPLKLDVESIDLALIKIPKSAELFELYLSQMHAKMNEDSVALCGFMTRNFTPRWLEIANHYFGDVSQSLAVKKARLLVLRGPKKDVEASQLFHEVPNDLDLKLKQYSGVFSSSKVDVATQIF